MGFTLNRMCTLYPGRNVAWTVTILKVYR